MNNAIYVLRYAKRYISGWSDVEHKFVVLAVIELCLAEGINQSGSQSEENFFSSFAATFWKNFRLIWKLVWATNQYCPIVVWEIWGVVWFRGQSLLFVIPNVNHYCGSWYWKYLYKIAEIFPIFQILDLPLGKGSSVIDQCIFMLKLV